MALADILQREIIHAAKVLNESAQANKRAKQLANFRHITYAQAVDIEETFKAAKRNYLALKKQAFTLATYSKGKGLNND